MPKYATKDLAELTHQLQLSPTHQRLSQVRGIEGLLKIVQPDRAYPYDMVCYHVTKYRNRRKSARPPIPGEKLISDLVTMAEQLTRRTAVPVGELEGEHHTYEELAEQLQVSTKTIRRWRRRGLMGFRAMFDDGVARLVYLQETVDRFVTQNKSLVERGAAFKQLTEEEKEQIVTIARELLGKKRMKLHVLARQISERTGRAVETIRYTLRRHDQAHPEQALFGGDGLPGVPQAQQRVWEAHERGDAPKAIASSFGIAVDEVKRIVREMIARRMKEEPVSCVYNELFDAPNADQLILEAPRPDAGSSRPTARPPKDLPAYLRSLYDYPLMTAAQEVDAFRRYNYLKFKASRCVEAMDVSSVTQAELDLVADWTAQFDGLRQEVVKANLRLVVSIAKKHVGWSPRFFEIISDGNMSLLRAVEKFDYARGFKFSTYASWAIMKNYARTIPEEHYHFTRYVTGQCELLDAAADHRAPDAGKLDRSHLTRALRQGMFELTERERDIVTCHFGLFDSGPAVTLEELGKRFGVTKERIRQIERRAINKIRGTLSPGIADLLTD